MAVEIPVIVDIDKAFKDAAERVPQAIAPLQKQISKKQLNVQVDVGTQKHPQLRKFKDLLNESQSSATQLQRAISAVNREIAALSKAGGFNPAKGLKTSERDLLALRAALETKLEAGNFIDSATEDIKKIAAGSQVAGREATSAISKTNAGLNTQKGLLSTLIGKVSAYTAVFAGLRLVRNVREVTAEFEMQRVALAGIIQDTTRANQLFSEIKAAAVQSPFEIKDLVSFTKQLSAYRIETDKLFDVTMRLADVSAGLGVDMSRLVLAYGQVRAASVLRGQELRQFTEAGIPLVDLLAKKFSELRGEMVSTGEVFELISNRAVPFAMIEEIFNDMTSAGGIFYEMQLKQSDTMKGQWMKLKDVISIAYDEMGRSTVLNAAMRAEIKILSSIIKEWERLASILNVAIYSFMSYKAAMKGIIPFYNLQQKSIARQIQLEKQQQIEQIRLASRTNTLTNAEKKRIAQIKKLTTEEVKRIYSLDKMSQAQATMFFWRNKDNNEIVKAIQQTGILTKTQMSAIKKMDGFQIRIKTWGSSIRTFFAKIGTAIASFWPVALLAALTSTISSLVQSTVAQAEAIKAVDKAYDEQARSLSTIENAYRKIQQAIADVSDEQERATKEAASFGQKLAQAQNVVELLKKFGMGGDFDLSLLNTENIDEFVEHWLEQLNMANELTRDWGRNVARVANAWEANLLGIHFAGDNLSTDIKQLTNAYVKLTSNKAYRQSVNDMRNYLDALRINNKEYYDMISAAIGEEANLAVAQKRRNETEYQYQQRLIKNYETVRKFAQSDNFILAGVSKNFQAMDGALTKFESRLDEVEHEFDKTWGSMEGQDEITIKMAIDKLFAENQWEDWLKEAWIERVNEKYQMNIQVVPTVGKVDVSRGMKGILTTEFENLFTAQELENLNSVTEIGKAIEEKMKKAADAIVEADKLANNFANNEAWSDKTKEKIKNAQLTINEELAKDEKDRNKEAINGALDLIDALTKQNGVYDEQIVKKKESAKAEYELAKAAKERLLSEGMSDMGKDIKQAFPGLMKDAFREATDENYISRFLISDEDLQKIKDGSDAYDVWAKHMKDIADEREKMLDAGVSEETVLEEQARLDAQKLAIEQELEGINERIAAWNYEEQKAQYDSLRLAVQQATTADARKKAEAELNAFIAETNIEERAVLKVEQERLLAQLGITNAALGAQTAIVDYFNALNAAEEEWKSFGKRYNFTLKDKPKGGTGQDPWILLFKNRMKFMQDFQKGVEDLDKYLEHSASLGREQEIMKGRGLSLGIKTEDLLGTPNELRAWYDKAIKEVASKIRSMGGREFAGMGVTEILAQDLTGRKIQKYQELLAELWKGLTDFDTNQIKQDMEEKLKKLSDDLKRSETARNFFQNILDLTGDEELAANMAVSVYGSVGKDFKDRLQEELYRALTEIDPEHIDKDLMSQIMGDITVLDIDDIKANLEKLPPKVKEVFEKAFESNEKYNADWYQNFIKTYQKAKTYQERIDTLELQRRQKREEAMKMNMSQSDLDSIDEYYNREVAKVQLEAMKDTYTWTKAFEDLEGVSTQTLNNLIDLIDEYIEKYGKDLEPQQLKELARQRESAKQQVNSRNAYKATAKAIGDFVAARKRADNLQKEGKESSEDYAAAIDDEREAVKRLGEAFSEIESEMKTVIESTKELMSVFASDEDASYFGEQLDNIEKTVSGIGKAGIGIMRVMGGDLTGIVQIFQGIGDFFAGIFGGINAAKLRKINKQIEHQQDILDSLERSYDRLEKAMAKAFGSDYIANYNEQLKNLAAQQAAYEEQARLESQKGKKADQEKIDEYKQSADDMAEQIADMQGQLAEYFTQTDLASAAKDFASSWIEAYKEFGSTTDAMKEKFQEMVQSMIEQSLGAKIMQTILKPLFESIDEMAKTGGELSAEEIAKIGQMAPEYIDKINEAMTTMMNQLAAAGYNVRQGVSGLTGISRNIAGASEESITGLAAGINTQNFYMSLISQNVAAILQSMTGGEVQGASNVAVPDTYKETMMEYAMHIPTISQNIADIKSMLNEVIRPTGYTVNKVVHAYIH